MTAIEPLVELLLELGITSPEAESLLRGVYVHTCRSWLAGQHGGATPSDVRIALVTGVHRNFVSRLLAEPPKIAEARELKGHRAERLLQAWHREPLYLDGRGKPRDLAERGAAPSFEALAARYLPSSPAPVVLQELHRAGVVELLPEQRVRVRSRTMSVGGLNTRNISDLGRHSKQLLETLTRNLRDPEHRLFCESAAAIDVEEARIPVLREVINQRATGFLQSLEAELASERRRPRKRGAMRATLSLTVFETQGRGQREGEGDEGAR